MDPFSPGRWLPEPSQSNGRLVDTDCKQPYSPPAEAGVSYGGYPTVEILRGDCFLTTTSYRQVGKVLVAGSLK